ncbi:MAG: hypothetical protein ACRD0K_20235 [Egibacteraceae bacterium]
MNDFAAPKAPGDAAGERFRERLHARVERSRCQLGKELTVIEALVRMGELDGAAHALDDQRLALRALGAQLERVVADAVGERAIERGAQARPHRRVPHTAVIVLAGLAGLGIAVSSVPYQQVSPIEDRTAREWLARLRPTQADAPHVTTEARALHDQILALPDSALADERVRGEIQRLMAEQSNALARLHGNPEADSLLAEARALSTTLNLNPHKD